MTRWSINGWSILASPGSWWRTTLHDSTHAADEDSLSIPALDAKYGVDILHDSLGRLSGTDVHGSVSGSRRYRYDLAGQLLQACTYQGVPCIGEYATTLTQDAYGYDATGNRKDPSIGAVIGAGNRVTWFKGYSISYDADGNIISKSGNGEVWTYTWDPFDKLTDVTLNGTLVYHFVYDAFGNRVDRCTVSTCSAGEREINDGSQLVFARNGSGTVTDEYGFYPGGDQPMSLRLPSGRTGVFITDPQLRGTVRAIADADKNATNMEFKTYTISPWGVVPADTGSVTRLRMAGQQYDQGSRLYFMRARYYDPDLGRFLSEDPIGISGGLNLYAYAGNNPVNAADPSGLCLEAGTNRELPSDPEIWICVRSNPSSSFPLSLDDPQPVSNRPAGLEGGRGGAGGTPVTTSGSGIINRPICVLARALQPVAIAVDFAAVYDGSKAIGALAEGGFDMTVGSFTRATANLSGHITRSRRLSTGLLAMAGETQFTAGALAFADATSVSIVSQHDEIRSLAEVPNAVSDVFLTPQVFEAVQACAANGY